MSLRSRIIAVGSTTSRNRIGRAFSLWLTAREAGLNFQYIGIDDGSLWEPLREHQEFRADVRTARDLADLRRQVEASTGPGAILVVCKPRPELLRLSREFTGTLPVIVDIDDPELLDPWGRSTLVLRAKRVVRFGPAQFRFGWARRVVRSMHVITSNPLLQAIYGGEVVPHVREAAASPVRHDHQHDRFTVGFVGTPREHKGIEEIRAAVADLARERDVRLRITAPAPPDAQAWEEWVGQTSLMEGRKLLEACDAVAIASRPGSWGDLQLPVKLIDAMAVGVPAVITSRPPLVWAAAGSALVVRDGCVPELRDALALIADDPDLARALGAAAWRRARTTFTPAAAAPHLVHAIERAEAAPHFRSKRGTGPREPPKRGRAQGDDARAG